MSGRPTPFDSGVSGAGAGREGDRADAGSASGPLAVVITGEDWLQAICPFLRAGDGSWRSASPAREHRCWAMDPPAELPVLTQQRLCLIRAHDGCERFLHARELRAASLAGIRSGTVDTPAIGVPTPGYRARRATTAADSARGVAAGVLRLPRAFVVIGVAAMAVVIAAVLVLGGGGGGSVPSPRSSVAPVLRSGDPVIDDPSPGPDGTRRYRIRAGDTLRTIADRFDVSVRQLRLANDLGDPPRLVEGDVIIIPGRD